MLEHISIHAAREGGDTAGLEDKMRVYIISIHAAREGGDVYITCLINVVCISIHAAREGGDTTVGHERLAAFLFQSTPPVKAATFCQSLRKTGLQHFNPRRP